MKEFRGPVYEWTDDDGPVTWNTVYNLYVRAMRRVYALPPMGPTTKPTDKVKLVPYPDAQPVLLLTFPQIRQLLNDPRMDGATAMQLMNNHKLFGFEVREVIR